GRHVFHEGRRQQRLHVDEAQFAARTIDDLQRLGEALGLFCFVGEVDGEQKAAVHDALPRLAGGRHGPQMAILSRLTFPRRSALVVIVPIRLSGYKGRACDRGCDVMGVNTVVPESYKPSDAEPFMNERQKDYFRRKLLAWRESIIAESRETLTALQNESENHPDIADRASSESDRAIELRARDRQRKLIAKIDAALARIE